MRRRLSTASLCAGLTTPMLSREEIAANTIRPMTPPPTTRRCLALQLERLDLQILGLVDAEQHDDEQEQHDDRAGIDDDLHSGQELGLLGHVHHGDAEQCEDEAQRGVNRMRARDDPDRPGQDHQGRARRRRTTASRARSPRRRGPRIRARCSNRPRRRSRRRHWATSRASSHWCVCPHLDASLPMAGASACPRRRR